MLQRPSSIMISEILLIGQISEQAPGTLLRSGREQKRERGRKGGNIYRHKRGTMKRLNYVSLMN